MGSDQSKSEANEVSLVEAHSYDEFAEQVAVIARLCVQQSFPLSSHTFCHLGLSRLLLHVCAITEHRRTKTRTTTAT